MICLECFQQQRSGDGVGVCEECGAAVCAEHARVVHIPGTPPSMTSLGGPPRRHLRCGFCSVGRPEARRANDPAEAHLVPCGHDLCLCPSPESV